MYKHRWNRARRLFYLFQETTDPIRIIIPPYKFSLGFIIKKKKWSEMDF